MKLFKTISATALAVAATLVTTIATNAKTEEKRSSFGYGNSITVNYDLSYYRDKGKEISFSVNPSMSTYYKNLYTNFGYNRYGSCGYVATGMLLSYYDTFWNDGFIAERFDYQEKPADNSQRAIIEYSPGIRNEYGVSTGVTLNSASNILKHYKKLADKNYFVPYLLKLGSEAKFYSSILNKEITYYNQANELGKKYGEKEDIYSVGGFDNNQLGDFLKYYLDNETDFADEYTIESKSIEFNVVGDTDDTEMREFMAKYIDKGYPVLTCTSHWKTRPSVNANEFEKLEANEGHVQVAYDYIRNSQGEISFIYNDGIRYYNPRYKKHGNTSLELTSSSSNVITEAYVLIPNLVEKTGSDNYIDSNGKSVDLSTMNGFFAKYLNPQDYEDSKITKINSVKYYAPCKQFVSFRTVEDSDTSFSNIELSYTKLYAYNLVKYLIDVIKTRGKAKLEDYKYQIAPDASYVYEDDTDTSGEYWDENCYLDLTVDGIINTDSSLSFDVNNSKTLSLFVYDYLS